MKWSPGMEAGMTHGDGFGGSLRITLWRGPERSIGCTSSTVEGNASDLLGGGGGAGRLSTACVFSWNLNFFTSSCLSSNFLLFLMVGFTLSPASLAESSCSASNVTTAVVSSSSTGVCSGHWCSGANPGNNLTSTGKFSPVSTRVIETIRTSPGCWTMAGWQKAPPRDWGW